MDGLRRIPRARRSGNRICALPPRSIQHQRRRASAAAAIAPAAPVDQAIHAVAPIARYPPTQPPSHKPPEFRKSQLLRSYASLLRSSPLILLFQHNNIRSVEWMALRREIAAALRKLEESRAKERDTETIDATISSGIKLQILQTGIFAAALRIVEFYHPETSHRPPSPPQSSSPSSSPIHPTDPHTQSSAPLSDATPSPTDPSFTHTLSRHAHDAVAYTPRTKNSSSSSSSSSSKKKKKKQPTTAAAASHTHGLEPLLSGPLCAITFPTIAPQHVGALLRLLAPSPPAFPAPRRREQPGYHEPAVQAAVQKLILLGARIEGRVVDGAGVQRVGGIEGGVDGLRARLLATLQGAGMGVVGVLEGAGRAVYGVVEGRRAMLEKEGEEGKSGEGEGEGEGDRKKIDANGEGEAS